MAQRMATELRRFWNKLRIEIVQMARPRNLILYAMTIVMFSVVSLILPYNFQVYLSIAAGVAIAFLLLAGISQKSFTVKVVFISGVVFLVVALFPKELLTPLFPEHDILRDFKHLSRILSIVLTALYVAFGILQFAHTRPRGALMKSFSNFFSVCNATISSELCACLHPIPFVDMLLVPLGVADLLVNRVKLGFVIMMMTLVFQIRASHRFYKARNKNSGKDK